MSLQNQVSFIIKEIQNEKVTKELDINYVGSTIAYIDKYKVLGAQQQASTSSVTIAIKRQDTVTTKEETTTL